MRVAAVVGVLALIAVVALLLLNPFGSGLPFSGDGPTSFSFELTRAKAAPITDRKPVQLQDEADEAAEAVKATMDQLYYEAYVNRSAWGSYDDAFGLFQEPAADSAEADVDVLTLGANAPEDYETVRSPEGTLIVVVLTNEKDVAVTAIARVLFHLDADLKSGGATRITSRGSFFLRPADEGWSIFAYRIDRNEQEAPSSPSPTEEAQ